MSDVHVTSFEAVDIASGQLHTVNVHTYSHQTGGLDTPAGEVPGREELWCDELPVNGPDDDGLFTMEKVDRRGSQTIKLRRLQR